MDHLHLTYYSLLIFLAAVLVTTIASA